MEQILFCSPNHAYRLLCIFNVIIKGSRGTLCPWLKELDPEPNHSRPSSFSEVKDTNCCIHTFFLYGKTVLLGPRLPHFWGFVITLRHTTLGRTPLDEGSTLPEISDLAQRLKESNMYANGGIKTRDPGKQPAADLWLRKCSNRDQFIYTSLYTLKRQILANQRDKLLFWRLGNYTRVQRAMRSFIHNFYYIESDKSMKSKAQ